ncbi:MAG: rod shape-determining protein RodA [Chloroflexi bacterium]|nr:rod shape-determining protein RodA [Chloroflexota bacterium]
MSRSEFWRHFDFWLLGAVILASAFGVAMIRSAIAGNESLLPQINRQILYASLGLLVILIATVLDYRYWSSLSRVLYFVTMLFLVILFISGIARFGAARWFEVGAILIQPAEVAKLAIIIALADYFARSQDAPRDWFWIAKSLLIALGLMIWILLQPNLSTTIVIMVIWAAMVWVNGLQIKHLVAIIATGLGAVIIGFPFLQGYQQERVLTFFFPDPNARHGATYNVLQALTAIGSGGWFGEGYGQGSQTQLRFMKVRHTDFILSVISEEFGLIGAVLTIALLVFIIYRCLRAARLARDTFGSMLAYGVAILIFFQASVNIAVNLNLIPVTGLPLPFISYGGSGLLSLMLGIGLVESVVVRHKPLEF